MSNYLVSSLPSTLAHWTCPYYIAHLINAEQISSRQKENEAVFTPIPKYFHAMELAKNSVSMGTLQLDMLCSVICVMAIWWGNIKRFMIIEKLKFSGGSRSIVVDFFQGPKKDLRIKQNWVPQFRHLRGSASLNRILLYCAHLNLKQLIEQSNQLQLLYHLHF